jgi:trigger factor
VKVSSNELPPRQVSLDIEVEQERLDRAVDDAYRRLAGRVDVPGFRRGKAPRSMVERLIGRDRIVEEALDHLVPEVVSEAIEQEKVEPYTRPRVESIEFEPLRLKAVVGLAPKVELGDYKSALRVAADEPRIGDEQVDAVIQRLRESYAQWAPVERPVQLGDRVGLDLAVRDFPQMDSKEAEYVVDAESTRPAPGFAQELVGLSQGVEKTFTLNMPDDYRDSNVAGKPAEFTVSLHWIKERELPALDDEFAQQVGDYADLPALRAAIESQVREREQDRVRQQLEEEVMSKLVDMSTIEFPPQLLDHQAQHMLETFTKNVERQGLQLPQYLRLVGKDQDAFEQEIRTEAETRIRRTLVLDAFADAEKIAADQETPAVDADDDATRETRALARLVELATSDGQTSEKKSNSRKEKTADRSETSDTERQTPKAEAPTAPGAEED